MAARSLTILLLALSSAIAAGADQIRAELQTDATTISFELPATMHTVHGTAELLQGFFVFDTTTGAASGQAIVAAASADTENAKRDRTMHGEVLLSSTYPRIVLRAEAFKGELALTGASDITLLGTLELLGEPHPIEVPMTVTIDGDRATVHAAFAVPYVEWGLEDPSTFLLRVGKEVPVTVTAENVSVISVPVAEQDVTPAADGAS
jgi:polyisoprenoid-binding protein YceI